MPFGTSKAAMMGAAGGGAPVEFSGGSSSVVGDYTYVTYASSGTVTCVSGGEIDLLVVGAGGGMGAVTGQNTGGGGGGGCLAGTGVEVEDGTYSLTIGACPVLNTGDPGGDTHILIAGWNLYACGGGNGGYGGYANCSSGANGRDVGQVTPYQRAGGAGGGGGSWYGYCAGGPGYGASTSSAGTGSGGGTWSTINAGNGNGSYNSYENRGGGGGSGSGASSFSADGPQGYTWLDGNMYSAGGDGGGTNTPENTAYGRGMGYYSQDGQDGVFIVRYLTDG